MEATFQIASCRIGLTRRTASQHPPLQEAEAVLTSMNITVEEREQYDTVVAKFNSFFGVRRNIIFERA